MNGLRVAVFLLLTLRAAAKERGKRGIVELGDMISSVLQRDPLDFANYGNWCGIGGSGPVVDRVDLCCFEHDRCYAYLTERTSVCRQSDVYGLNYEWYFDPFRRRLSCGK